MVKAQSNTYLTYSMGFGMGDLGDLSVNQVSEAQLLITVKWCNPMLA
jgi:hypothetical protein